MMTLIQMTSVSDSFTDRIILQPGIGFDPQFQHVYSK